MIAGLPSLRRKHRFTANGVLALLNAAWKCRARIDRPAMRELAQDAVKLSKLWKTLKQSEFSFSFKVAEREKR